MKRRADGKHPRNATKRNLSASQIRAHDNALRTLSLMRTKHLSLAAAAREAGTTSRTVVRHIGKAVTKSESGRYKARPSDRLTRSLNFITADGPIAVTVRGLRLASKIAKYSNAVQRYLETGQTDALKEFAGKSIKVGKVTYRFVTDTRLLNRLGRAGEVSFEDLYVH